MHNPLLPGRAWNPELRYSRGGVGLVGPKWLIWLGVGKWPLLAQSGQIGVRERLGVGRVTRLASPAAKKACSHPLSVAAVTPSARETISRSPPRSRGSTASRLRRAT